MRLNLFRRASIGSLSLVCLAAAGSPGQVAAQDAGNAPADTHDDDGFDKGLLGLAGLAGLLGRGTGTVRSFEVRNAAIERHQPSLSLTVLVARTSWAADRYFISITVRFDASPILEASTVLALLVAGLACAGNNLPIPRSGRA